MTSEFMPNLAHLQVASSNGAKKYKGIGSLPSAIMTDFTGNASGWQNGNGLGNHALTAFTPC